MGIQLVLIMRSIADSTSFNHVITIILLALICFAAKHFWFKNWKFANKLESRPFCAVCLDEIMYGDKFRRLPKCRHCFHAECIDAWLLSRSTCPLCRNQVSLPHLRYPYPTFFYYFLSFLQTIDKIINNVPLNFETP